MRSSLKFCWVWLGFCIICQLIRVGRVSQVHFSSLKNMFQISFHGLFKISSQICLGLGGVGTVFDRYLKLSTQSK